MRLRFAVLAAALTTLVAVPVSVVSAAPHHNRGLTINATPNPVNAGSGVFIYGQLNGPSSGSQTIRLYHRVNPAKGFTLIGSTTTNPQGFYQFTREEGVVYSNREWFVRGPAKVHSRTLRERVYALVSIAASSANTTTRHPVVFSGHVTPNHAGDRVYLQEEKGTSDDFRTIKTGLLGPGSNYSITHAWRVPGVHVVRVLLRRDPRNIASTSEPLSVTVQQAQVPGFTISSSAPIIPEGSSATISGVLSKSAAQSSSSVTLWERAADQPHFVVVASTTTKTDGSYSFNVSPTRNELYQVRTTFAPKRHTAVLFEGVRDIVTLTPSSTTSQVGGHVTFTGVVTPDKAGHRIFLQLQGQDGDWHDVAVNTVRFDSTYRFGWTFGEPGAHHFRTRIEGDESNVGAISAPVTINVSGTVAVGTTPTM